MRPRFFYSLIIFGLFFIPWKGKSQTPFYKTSVSGNYHFATHAKFEYQIFDADTAFVINLSIDARSEKNFEEAFTLQYEVKKSYTSNDSKIIRSLNTPVHGIGRIGSVHHFRFPISKDTENKILILKLRHNESGLIQYEDLRLQGAEIYQPVDFYLMSATNTLPVNEHYVLENDSLYLHSVKADNIDLFVFRYADKFPPADPPMKKLKKNISKSLVIDSLFNIPSGKAFTLKRTGLYFIQSDTSSTKGIGLRVESSAFPSFRRFEDIIEPLIYISTNDEINKIEAAKDKRKAFEEYWLKIARSEDMAGQLIKHYYNRIEEANQLFTGYKPGWKTDMGIIYIIYGPPDEVIRNGETEVWHYNRIGSTRPRITFNFLYLKNIFCQNHFMLIRDTNYREDWLRTIDNWRQGNM